MNQPPKFENVFNAVVDGIAKNGRSPVLKEICAITGIASMNTVSYDLDWLVANGYLEEIRSFEVSNVIGHTLPGAVHIVNGKDAFANLFSLMCDSPHLDQDDINRMVNSDMSLNYAEILKTAWVAIRESGAQ